MTFVVKCILIYCYSKLSKKEKKCTNIQTAQKLIHNNTLIKKLNAMLIRIVDDKIEAVQLMYLSKVLNLVK